MVNEVESIDVLIEALERCCTLYTQLVSENTRLRKLESDDQPTEPCIRRVDGKAKILTADKAIVHDDEKVHAQALVIHDAEDDFRAAIRDTKEAINHRGLADAIEPIVDKPEKWIAEMLGKINRLQTQAIQINTITPEERMEVLTAVIRELNHLQCSQETRSRLTPTEPGPETAPPKRNDAIGDVDRVAEAIAIMVRDPMLKIDEIAAKVGLNRSTLYRDSRFKDARKLLRENKAESPQRRLDQFPRGEKNADGQIEAWSE